MNKVNSGCYQVIFKLKDNLSLTIGAVGHFVLPEGYYIYTGKANRNLDSILRRHLLKKKKVRFHFDYLSVTEALEISKIIVFPEIFNPCMLQQFVINETGGHELIPRFGTGSDDSCYSHLIFSPKDPEKKILKLRSAFKLHIWEG